MNLWPPATYCKPPSPPQHYSSSHFTYDEHLFEQSKSYPSCRIMTFLLLIPPPYNRPVRFLLPVQADQNIRSIGASFKCIADSYLQLYSSRKARYGNLSLYPKFLCDDYMTRKGIPQSEELMSILSLTKVSALSDQFYFCTVLNQSISAMILANTDACPQVLHPLCHVLATSLSPLPSKIK